MYLQEKVIVITGGARGIGLETAKLFSKYGAKVIALYNQSFKENFDNIKFIKLDVTSSRQCNEVVKKIIEEYTKIDVLINNAGIINDAKIEKTTSEQFDKVIDVNLKGTFNITKEVVPYMKKENCGNIINIASVSGLYGNIGQTNYAASKAGIIGMTYTWAKELGKNNIRVNAIAPGFTETDMTKEIPEKIKQKIKDKIILKRFAKPIEIANVILFLADNSSSYITGTTINVDGGIEM
jgi:3-oxoacyl-[acyl-carrier-protein] reductase